MVIIKSKSVVILHGSASFVITFPVFSDFDFSEHAIYSIINFCVEKEVFPVSLTR